MASRPHRAWKLDQNQDQDDDSWKVTQHVHADGNNRCCIGVYVQAVLTISTIFGVYTMANKNQFYTAISICEKITADNLNPSNVLEFLSLWVALLHIECAGLDAVHPWGICNNFTQYSRYTVYCRYTYKAKKYLQACVLHPLVWNEPIEMCILNCKGIQWGIPRGWVQDAPVWRVRGGMRSALSEVCCLNQCSNVGSGEIFTAAPWSSGRDIMPCQPLPAFWASGAWGEPTSRWSWCAKLHVSIHQ